MSEPTLNELVLRYLTRSEIDGILGDLVEEIPRSCRKQKEGYVDAILEAGYGVLLADAVQQKQAQHMEIWQHRGDERLAAVEERRRTVHSQLILGSSLRENVHGSSFLDLPSTAELKDLYANFYAATSNAALQFGVCAVCARSRRKQGSGLVTQLLHEIPNRHVLRRLHRHPNEDTFEDYLLVPEACYGSIAGGDARLDICQQCLSALSRPHVVNPPKYSLANYLWVGRVPPQLSSLTLPEQLLIARHYPRAFIVKLFPKDRRGGHDRASLQHALRGNVTTYSFNMDRISDMVEGRLMPQQPSILVETLAVTFVGVGPLPKKWIESTFRIRRQYVRDALVWLKKHNPKYYGDIEITEKRLQALPEDDVPVEILATMRQNEASEVADMERAGDVNVHEEEDAIAGDVEPDVIPLQQLGVVDIDLTKLAPSELTMRGLSNLLEEASEGGYVVQHGWNPASTFQPRIGDAHYGTDQNYWEKAFPTLFPYGEGGIERSRPTSLTLLEHVQWLMDYYDRRFRVHHSFLFTACSIQQRRQALMSAKVEANRKSFAADITQLSAITAEDLHAAALEESQKRPISNRAVKKLRECVHGTAARVLGTDSARIKLRSRIWSTSVCLGPPNVWLTINPDDLQDPIAQCFVGEQLDLDNFINTAGPSRLQRAHNIASDGYGAAAYFDFIIHTVLSTLFGIQATEKRIQRRKGIYGEVQAYFGVIESQGRGTLHIHMLLWLSGSPSATEWQTLLQDAQFRVKFGEFLKANFRADHNAVHDEATVRNSPVDSNIGFNRPPHPDSANYWQEVADLEGKVVRAKQIHTCTTATCLRVNRQGELTCKRGAPWDAAEETKVLPSGECVIKRGYRYINIYNPAISVNLRCNNDNKALTNGPETEGLTYYFATYATKKQGKTYNLSAVLGRAFAYHVEHNPYIDSLLRAHQLLLFRCVNVLNGEQELPEPMAALFLQGKSETVSSHTYSPIQWKSYHCALLRQYPTLRPRARSSTGASTNTGADVNNESEAETHETLHVSVGSDRRVHFSTAVQDYEFRGTALEEMNVLDFYWDTYEKKLASASPSNDVAPREPPALHVSYQAAHPKAGSHVRIVRHINHNALPDFSGHFLPRNDEADAADLYYASVLMLLKPWRTLHGLKADHQSWSDAYNSFLQFASPRQHRIVQNLQHMYRCQDAANKDRPKVLDVPDNGVSSEQCIELENEGGDEDGDGDGDGEEEEEDLGTINAIEARKQTRGSIRSEQYAEEAVAIGALAGVFNGVERERTRSGSNAVGDDLTRLTTWMQIMARKEQTSGSLANITGNPTARDGNIVQLDEMLQPADISFEPISENALAPADPSSLGVDQRRAYDIITTHLDDFLAGKRPAQLRMILTGEGGTGKSKVIQTVTDYFYSKGVPQLLIKAAYTGIAASLIGGKTLHSVIRLSASSHHELSDYSRKALEQAWSSAWYFIVDEVSMMERALVQTFSYRLGIAKGCAADAGLPFGGINVIFCGDFHQFPPIAKKPRAPLYIRSDQGAGDTVNDCLGRTIYEMFDTVVILKEQFRVQDTRWHAFLTNLRNGAVEGDDVQLLNRLVLTHPQCPHTDFSTEPWADACLVTPRHSVRVKWNEEALRKHCRAEGVQLFKIRAQDRIHGRRLTLAEQSAASNRHDKRGSLQLPEEVNIALHSKVMVTVNVETDLDIANGARGRIEGIVFEANEPPVPITSDVVHLTNPPLYILIRLDRTKIACLPGLEPSVIPIQPQKKSFNISLINEDTRKPRRKLVTRHQLPMTDAYAFTDYRSQGQTIEYVIVDLAKPPERNLTLFNIYVALSRSSGQNTIRILRPFDPKPMLQALDPSLAAEDARLDDLNEQSLRWWNSRR